MKLVVKCWKTKNGKLVKGLFYEGKNGCVLLTFDKFVIVEVLGSFALYNELIEGEKYYIGEEG